MADDDAGKGSPAGPKVRYDDIVARVHADPAKTQGTTLLSGYVGKGDAAGRVRIYPDISFGTYYDVAEDDVVHSVPIPKETSPHGGSHVWVKPGAEVKQGPSVAAQAAAAVPQVTMVGHTCPNGDCTFFGGCHQPTQHGMTCPRHICGETMPPTIHHLTCPRFICTETMPSGIQTIVCTQHLACVQQAQPAAAAMPTPTATFFHTCGMACASGVHTIVCTQHVGCQQNSGIETIVCTQHLGCQQQVAGAAAVAGPFTINPTQCTRCFICPPITAPQTRSGVFCPYG